MKRLSLILGFILLLSSAFGEKVPKRMAQEVASNFLAKSGMEKYGVIDETIEVSKKEIVSFYIINYEPEGWALVAADDRVRPVLAYSLKGRFIVGETNISPETKYWIENYNEQIHSIIKENEIPRNKDWDKWLDGDGFQTKSGNTSVSPLLEVLWNQNSGWNRFCPEDEEGPGGHAYVGCVAVAMAQAMSVVKYPFKPQGKHSYVHDKYGTIYLNYNDEEPYNWSGMSLKSSDEENARLLYHCAVAVNMDFGPDGSGTLSSRVANALKKHFGYTDEVKYFKRFENDIEWKELLKSELDKGNVLIYSGDPGTGDPGHSFNIDGYDINGYFHFNWGWSGKYNGYYTIDNINPGTDKYNQNQDVVVGISEPYFGPTDISLSDLQVLEGLPAGSFVATVEVEDNSENDLFSFKLDGGPKFPKGTHEAAFYIENDTLKTKYVFDASQKDEYILNIEVTDSDLFTYREEFLIKIKANTYATGNKSDLLLNTHPNVFYSSVNHAITISSENLFFTNNIIEVYDIRGVKVFSGKANSEKFSINTSNFENGIYLVRIMPDNIPNKSPYVKKLYIGN